MNRIIRNSVRYTYVTVQTGPNAGMKIKTSIQNCNPRNLEMLNIAHRDNGWVWVCLLCFFLYISLEVGRPHKAVGPTIKDRYMQAHHLHKNDDKGVKEQLMNLPHNHGYHYIQAEM